MVTMCDKILSSLSFFPVDNFRPLSVETPHLAIDFSDIPSPAAPRKASCERGKSIPYLVLDVENCVDSRPELSHLHSIAGCQHVRA